MRSDPLDVATAVTIGRGTRRKERQNLAGRSATTAWRSRSPPARSNRSASAQPRDSPRSACPAPAHRRAQRHLAQAAAPPRPTTPAARHPHPLTTPTRSRTTARPMIPDPVLRDGEPRRPRRRRDPAGFPSSRPRSASSQVERQNVGSERRRHSQTRALGRPDRRLVPRFTDRHSRRSAATRSGDLVDRGLWSDCVGRRSRIRTFCALELRLAGGEGAATTETRAGSGGAVAGAVYRRAGPGLGSSAGGGCGCGWSGEGVRWRACCGWSGRCSRLSQMALSATMMLEAPPDMRSAAISGLSVKPIGSSAPAAIGDARLL